MNLGLEGRRALVMGASRGLGRAVAECLIAEGAATAICARDDARLRTVAETIGASAFPADLTGKGVAGKLVSEVEGSLGPLDILVVNTGGPPARTFDQASDAEWQGAFDALCMSCIGGIRAVLPGMRARGWGRILVITSVAAREPIGNLMLSNTLRAGLHGLVNALSRECAADGVTVNAVLPGYTMTERLAEVGVNEAETAALVPARRMGTPAEFAALVTFLASAQASYITGQAVACDGGLLRSI